MRPALSEPARSACTGSGIHAEIAILLGATVALDVQYSRNFRYIAAHNSAIDA
jgi:hypothetical protein